MKGSLWLDSVFFPSLSVVCQASSVSHTVKWGVSVLCKYPHGLIHINLHLYSRMCWVIWFCSPAAGRAISADNNSDNHTTVERDSWVFSFSLSRMKMDLCCTEWTGPLFTSSLSYLYFRKKDVSAVWSDLCLHQPVWGSCWISGFWSVMVFVSEPSDCLNPD